MSIHFLLCGKSLSMDAIKTFQFNFLSYNNTNADMHLQV